MSAWDVGDEDGAHNHIREIVGRFGTKKIKTDKRKKIKNETFYLIWLNFKAPFCQHFEYMLSCGASVCPVEHRDEEKTFNRLFFPNIKRKKVIILCVFFTFWYHTEEIVLSNYNLEVIFSLVSFIMLVPNCPFSYRVAELSVCLLGAKLSYHPVQ